MKYLNVSLLGLGGRLHPAITGITTTHQVRKMQPHIKMLTRNYLSRQSGDSDQCCLCFNDIESLEHLLAQCVQLNDLQKKIK